MFLHRLEEMLNSESKAGQEWQKSCTEDCITLSHQAALYFPVAWTK